jgi:hypothetical protein
MYFRRHHFFKSQGGLFQRKNFDHRHNARYHAEFERVLGGVPGGQGVELVAAKVERNQVGEFPDFGRQGGEFAKSR